MAAVVNGGAFQIRHWKLNVRSFRKKKNRAVLTVAVAGSVWAGTDLGTCAGNSSLTLDGAVTEHRGWF